MKVLALSDIHAAVDAVEDIVAREQDYDLVLVAGDITDTSAGDYEGAARAVLAVLDEDGALVKAVPGNMDDERVLELLIEQRVNLHKDLFSLGDRDFVGFGGVRTSFDTPFEPEDAERGQVLEQLLERTKTGNRVIVSHEPPKGTGADRTSDGEHVGSDALRGIIEEQEVDLVLCGHIHESRTVDEVDGTVVVNPGPVQEGRYAVLELDDGVDAELRG